MIHAVISTELITELERLWPNVLPRKGVAPVTVADIYYAMGQQHVITTMRKNSEQQLLNKSTTDWEGKYEVTVG